jgi:hypothetical protein
MLPLLLEVLDRLREIPGLGFLRTLYEDLRMKKAMVDSQARKISTQKRLAETSLKRASEIPSVVKGSKKRT